MTLRVKIDGGKRLRKKLKRIPVDSRIGVRKAIARGALKVQGAAVRSIREPKSGRVYTTFFFTDSQGRVRPIGTRPPHRASAPGEAPAWDTGTLAGSIFAEMDDGGLGASVGTDLKYGEYLEFGTTKMAERPWLRPAFAQNKAAIRQDIIGEVQKALRKSTRV